MKNKICILICILIVILLTGCGTDTNVSVLVKRDNDRLVVYDGDYLITYCKNKLVGKERARNAIEPALTIPIKDGKYSFKYEYPTTYMADINDVSGYMSKLLSKGYTLDKIYQDSQKVDIVVSKDATKIRLIYQNCGEVKIFSKNKDRFLVDVPYISEAITD